MTRKTARALAVQLLYSAEMTGKTTEETIADFFEPEYYASLAEVDAEFKQQPTKKQLAYITTLLNRAVDERERFYDYIARHVPSRRPERISPVVVAILRCAMCEIMFLEDVPTAVAVNEAVELAKEYEEDDAAHFINGVLRAFVQELEPDAENSAETAAE